MKLPFLLMERSCLLVKGSFVSPHVALLSPHPQENDKLRAEIALIKEKHKGDFDEAAVIVATLICDQDNGSFKCQICPVCDNALPTTSIEEDVASKDDSAKTPQPNVINTPDIASGSKREADNGAVENEHILKRVKIDPLEEEEPEVVPAIEPPRSKV